MAIALHDDVARAIRLRDPEVAEASMRAFAGLPDPATRASRLSGGQQQRLCIARAVALEPSVLLMDEPCSALDPISSGVVEDLIANLRGRYTQLIVTHNLAQARRIADYAALFWVQDGVGRLIEYGTVQQIFETPQEALTTAYVNGIRG